MNYFKALQRGFVAAAMLAVCALAAGTPAPAAGGTVHQVFPSNDQSGDTDWHSIMAAFDAAASAGEGGIVDLASGHFYVAKPLEVFNFSGTLRGAGKDATFLNTAPGKLFENTSSPLLPKAPVLVTFALDDRWVPADPANVTVESMTFRANGPSATWGSHGSYYNMLAHAVNVMGISRGFGNPGFETRELSLLNVTFRHVGVDAYKAGGFLNGLTVQGEIVYEVTGADNLLFKWNKPIKGAYVWQDVTMNNTTWGIGAFETVDSTLIHGGGPEKKIVFRNGTFAVQSSDLSNGTMEVSYVETYNAGAVYTQQGGYNDFGELYGMDYLPSRVSVHHNTVRVAPGRGAMNFLDFPILAKDVNDSGVPLMQLTVTNNQISPYNPAARYSFGIALQGASAAEVSHNEISGATGNGAILIMYSFDNAIVDNVISSVSNSLGGLWHVNGAMRSIGTWRTAFVKNSVSGGGSGPYDGLTAISLGNSSNWFDQVVDARVVNNEVRGFRSKAGGPILFGQQSRSCTAIGGAVVGGVWDSVINLGTDNRVVGYGAQSWSAATLAQEGEKKVHELRHTLVTQGVDE